MSNHETRNDQLTYEEVVLLVRWMADHDFAAEQIAYAVEKPQRHLDYLSRARAGLDPQE